MKKSPEDSLKRELDKGNNFVDYFVVIGLKQDLIFSEFLYENDLNALNNSELLNPEFSSKFPPFDKTTINVDENMIKHCFPNGFKIKESATPPSTESFCLILDNNYFSINFPQKYISCLIFYESLVTYKKIYDKYKSYEEEAKEESPNSTLRNINSNMNNNINNYNATDMELNLNTISSNYNTESMQRLETGNLNTMNTLRTVENNVYLNYNTEIRSTLSVRSRNPLGDSVRVSKIFSSLSMSGSAAKYKNYYAPKCICLVSVYPFFIEFSKILKTIYKFTRSQKLRKPLEKIIENLVIEVPVPPRGFYSVEYQLFNEKYILSQTPMNQLPFLSIEFEKIFVNFKIEQILEIYKHVLLETRIIFFSSDISNLTPIIQGFISLIYPFKYPFQYVTILPNENFNFLESVSPYIIGINLKYTYNFFNDHEIDMENMTVLIVDIDNRRLELTSPNLNQFSEISYRKKLMMEEFPDLPKHYKSKLISRITEYIGKIKSNANSKEDRDNFSLTLRSLFFQFIVNILQNYNKYLNMDYYTHNEITSPSINTLFKVEEFINSCEYNDRPFYRKLIKETQIFVEFILKRMIPKDSKEKLEILLFDEHLMEKNSRRIFSKKVFTPFIHSNLYDIKHTYSVQKHRGINEEEINYFKNSIENRKEALKFGQEIFFEKGEVLISYPIFPLLMSHLYFKNSVKLYFIPPNLSEELEPINVDIVSKSHLGSVSIHHSEMENYIYLCWLQLWASTFWYHDEEEKRYRFQQLLKVLDSVINHEMEIFNLLFEALSKHGEDYMILKLYERLVYYKLNPSYSICTTVMKLIDKKQLLNKLGVISIIKYVERYDFNKEYDTKTFRRRTIKNKYDLNIITNDVQFYTWDTCIDCQTNINLEKLSRDFQNMRRDILWVNCPNCGTGLLPKIAVRFGRELNSYDKLKFFTSSYEGFVLYSPFYLKYNYNNGLLKEFGIKLDVDSFKMRFNAIFWDSILYFKIKDLNFDFMLPYENEIKLDKLNLYLSKSLKIKTVSKLEKKKVVIQTDYNNENVNIKENEINQITDNNNENEINRDENNLIKNPSNEEDFKPSRPENAITMTSISFTESAVCSPQKIFNRFSSDNKIISTCSLIKQNTANLSLISSGDTPTQQFNRSYSSYKLERTGEVNLSTDKKENLANSNKDLLLNIQGIVLNQETFKDLNTSDFTQSILVTEQSYINANNLIDISVYDSSRIIDSEQSILVELDSYRGAKKNFYNIQLKTIKEDIDENQMLENRENSSELFRISHNTNRTTPKKLFAEDAAYKVNATPEKEIKHELEAELEAELEDVLEDESVKSRNTIKSSEKEKEVSGTEGFFFTKRTSISEENGRVFEYERDRDKTPTKSHYNSDTNVLEIFKNHKYNFKYSRKGSLDKVTGSSSRLFLQKIIDDIDIEDKLPGEHIM